jgi:hypothetical protein
VPIIITSLRPPGDVVDAVHSYGGLVFHDVISLRHAQKAMEQGVDGIIAVCAGAGGHAGPLSPFALVKEIRREFDGVLILSGAMSSGGDILAAQAMGADLAYIGTRFIATREANAPDEYKQMIVSSKASDIVYTPRRFSQACTAATSAAASKTPAWIRTTCLTWTSLRWTSQVLPNRMRRRGAIFGEQDRALATLMTSCLRRISCCASKRSTSLPVHGFLELIEARLEDRRAVLPVRCRRRRHGGNGAIRS